MHSERYQSQNDLPYDAGSIVYWMSRDQRVRDNWALIHAQQLARDAETTVEVIFSLRSDLTKGAGTARMLDCMLSGLQEVEERLAEKGISFTFLVGDPADLVPKYLEKVRAGLLVSDFSPLRVNRSWYRSIEKKIKIPFHLVDAHNIVPVWVASEKQEYAARYLRKKLHGLLPTYMDEFPGVQQQGEALQPHTDWEKVREQIQVDESIKLPDGFEPGAAAAHRVLRSFIDTRLERYDAERNDPTADVLSGLSPYLHFGQIAPQRVALSVERSDVQQKNKEAYLEELIVRRELSDNYCYYNEQYDQWEGLPEWARKTLQEHRDDPREHVYSLEQFENAATHDDAWNAAQQEMVQTGKMHGYMRMYWAKKILEWTKSPEEALQIAQDLNDRYELDGRDPNGYVGIAWSIGGLHDRPWFEREIFGKVRYMSCGGLQRKFDLATYIERFSGKKAQD